MSVRTRLSAVAIGAVIATCAAVMPADAASADGSAALTKAKAAVTQGITDRLNTLGRLQTALTDSTRMPQAAHDTLTHQVSSDISGLTSLKTEVAGETTLAAVAADHKAMLDDYRVYILMVPQVHLTRALDVEDAALARLVRVHDALAARLAKHPAADTQANNDLLADLTRQVQAGESQVAGQDASLLALKPGPDGKTLSGQVSAIRRPAKDARDDIKKAIADAKQVRDALRDARKASGS